MYTYTRPLLVFYHFSMKHIIIITTIILYYIGGYSPTDGSSYSCSFVTPGVMVTMVVMGIWYIVGIIADVVLLVVTFMWKDSKLVHYINASSYINHKICSLF